jgi:riboflavin synthase
VVFTGIVEELGGARIVPTRGVRLEIAATTVLDDATLGASIAVNGCCLTVVELHDGWWAADAVAETLDRTALADLTDGSPVNLERPVRLADRLGGHVVQGHVDGVGTLVASEALPDGSTSLTSRRRPLLRYVVEEGSITVDGIQPHRGRPRRFRLTVPAPRSPWRSSPPARGHHAGRQAARRPREPRGRRAGRTSSACSGPTTATTRRPSRSPEKSEAHDAVQHDQGSRRRHRRGELVIVVDDEDRENEGDLITAADVITPESMAFMIRYTSGVICMPLEGDRPDQLRLR